MTNKKTSTNKSSLKANIATAILVAISFIAFITSGVFYQPKKSVTIDEVNTDEYTAKCLSYKDVLDEQNMALCQSEAFNAESLEGQLDYQFQTVKISIALLLLAIAVAFRLSRND